MARRSSVHDLIQSRKAPKPVGAYSQALRVNEPGAQLFVSGQIPMELPSGKIYTGNVKKQAEIALSHVKSIVEDAGFSMDEIVKCSIFLTDMKHLETVDAVYQTFFTGGSLPARVVVAVAGLPKDVNVEVEAIAVKKAVAQEQVFPGEGSGW